MFIHRKMLKQLYHILNVLRLWPAFAMSSNERSAEDMQRWVAWKSCPYRSRLMRFVFLMCDYPAFRNICYYRMGRRQYAVRWLCPPMNTLFIHCKDIGGLTDSAWFCHYYYGKEDWQECQDFPAGYDRLQRRKTPGVGRQCTGLLRSQSNRRGTCGE